MKKTRQQPGSQKGSEVLNSIPPRPPRVTFEIYHRQGQVLAIPRMLEGTIDHLLRLVAKTRFKRRVRWVPDKWAFIGKRRAFRRFARWAREHGYELEPGRDWRRL